MIKVSIHWNNNGQMIGFRCLGHAGYAESGSDIVCAAVSALVITTMNSIEQFTSDTFDFQEDEESGLVDFKIVSSLSDRSELLLASLLLGLQGIEEGYGHKYIKVNRKK
jgi:uncharacterized protein YsxB (DUF464 family)